ncbi:hypothetical protein DM860_015820 [Cuscuta australis]|uniref:PORR domain-containing protein n=1 Tax=Cuscuta australis TaxID=267555 RepID=A0A328E2K6_9ASTE|nr:hypothetical protein DM860_015820 [Cuscuta australis]
MEPKILSCPPKITPCFGAFPVFLSYKSSLLQKPKPQFACSQLSVSGHHLEKTYFLGKSLDFGVKIESLGNLRKPRLPVSPISAAVKRRKEMPFDNVIQRDKKLKLVLTIRKLLMSQPDKIMSLRQLGRFRRALGLQKKRRVIVLLKNFPAVFKIVEEGAYSLKFTLTPEAERLYLEELQAKNEMEGLLVIKLRKLLMMSLDKRILLEKIAHLRTDLGLPLEFRDTICLRYPQYFKVLATERGPALELTHWDPQLAVSVAERDEEENKKREWEERDLIIDREPRFNRVKLPKGLNLSKSEMRRMCQFRDMPYISPYSDFSMLRRGSREKEKHACGVVHEILSLTVEKRTLVDHLTHFRDEFRFSQQLRGMLIRHPNMFYVSLKGSRDSVFLREAYHNSELIEKDRLLLIKEKMRSLVSVERRTWKNIKTSDADYNNKLGRGGEGEEKPGIDKLIRDDGFDEEEDEDGDFEDEWSDDGGDDLPPDFNDDDDDDDEYMNVENVKPRRKVDDPKEKDEGVLIPVFPDGRPRERW